MDLFLRMFKVFLFLDLITKYSINVKWSFSQFSGLRISHAARCFYFVYVY